jgi:ferredoxin
MAKVDPKFGKELIKYGAVDFTACYNCGTCTAVCSLSTEENSFPREMVRYSVLGMKDSILASNKPWLCYYCGECTTHCPKTANPGELMMTLRRWLTSKYDWTGLSAFFYKFPFLTPILFLLLAIGVVFYAYLENYNVEKIMNVGHYFEFFAVLTVGVTILLPNLIRMWWFLIGKQKIKVPFKQYLIQFKELIVHMFTQKRALSCPENKFRWFEHFILVLGYLGLLFTTVVLGWLHTDNLFIIILGYIESAVIFIVTADFVYGRIKKNKELNKFSHPSDWYFVIWLFLMGVTAFFVRLFVDLDLIENNLWLYLIHMMVLVQWALVIVPFGKWTHFLYRSFAMYYEKLKEVAQTA